MAAHRRFDRASPTAQSPGGTHASSALSRAASSSCQSGGKDTQPSRCHRPIWSAVQLGSPLFGSAHMGSFVRTPLLPTRAPCTTYATSTAGAAVDVDDVLVAGARSAGSMPAPAMLATVVRPIATFSPRNPSRISVWRQPELSRKGRPRNEAPSMPPLATTSRCLRPPRIASSAATATARRSRPLARIPSVLTSTSAKLGARVRRNTKKSADRRGRLGSAP